MNHGECRDKARSARNADRGGQRQKWRTLMKTIFSDLRSQSEALDECRGTIERRREV
jgi:hypothetical protein